jgi:hypothetical protein
MWIRWIRIPDSDPDTEFFTDSDPLVIGQKEGVKFTPKNLNFYLNVLFNLLLNKKF